MRTRFTPLAPALTALTLFAFATTAPAQTRNQPARRGALAEFADSLQALSERVSPSIVQIFVTANAVPDKEDQSATGEPVVQRSSGSGVIVDADGYIVTNAHVVLNATRLEVELPVSGSQGRSILKRRGRLAGAQIVGIDSETDVAILKVDATGLPALPFGDSDELRPGHIVLAFGSPLGLQTSVTMGVVSAVARQLRPEDPMIYIQTDAPINPGNSGGALVDTEGRLVGVNTLIFSQSGGHEGIGFAAPSNIVRNVFQQIRKTGRVRRGEIGVFSQTITPLMADALGISGDARVILADVHPRGPAAQAGLQPGDLILTLDGKQIENGRQFRINLYTRGVGETVTIEAQRGDRRFTARVPVVEREHDPGKLRDLVALLKPIRPLAITALDLSPTVTQLLPPLRRPAGVVVGIVTSGAPFSQQGRLQAGDVIYSLNGNAVGSVQELNNVAEKIRPGTPSVLQIERQGVLMYLAFRVE